MKFVLNALFFTKGLVASIKIVEVIRNTVVWMIIFVVKKLTIIANKAPIPNQKIKNPTVAISAIKQTPEIINQICQGNI